MKLPKPAPKWRLKDSGLKWNKGGRYKRRLAGDRERNRRDNKERVCVVGVVVGVVMTRNNPSSLRVGCLKINVEEK